MSKPRVNPKAFALDVLSRLPDNASLKDLEYEFDLILGLIEGMQDTEEGRTIPHEQAMAEFREWISKSTGRAKPAAT